MSIKKLFGSTNKSRNYLAETNEKDAFKDVESVKNMQEIAIKQETFVPQIDYSEPENFAKFGSAYQYYKSAVERIIDYYPYDGSDYEFNKFYNKSLDIEKYIFNNLYPRTNGYANFDSSSYVDLTGGPHSSSALTTAALFKNESISKRAFSNIYDTDIYTTEGLPTDYGSGTRESNLKANFDTGVTVEFWLKSKDLTTNANSVVFDMWNNNASGTVDAGRLTIEILSASSGTPFRFTAQSGSISGTLFQQSVGQTITSTTLDTFNHYAFVFQNSGSNFVTKLYLNGYLNDTIISSGVPLGELPSKEMEARIGSFITVPFRADAASSTRAAGAHTLTGSVDEFRYWKAARNGEEIGRSWFTHVRGGTNSDISNTTLGIYYKFNEGTTGDNAIDARVLDYSGRLSNGVWTGTPSRTLSSAIVETSASAAEFKDPIIYSTHPEVVTLKNGLLSSGSWHDGNNNASFYSLIPSWIMEEHEMLGNTNPEVIAHIVGSYFDKLYLQISALTTFKQLQNTSASYSPLFMAQHLPQSLGLYTPELFVDADVISRFLNRTEDFNFESDLTDIKNLIYQNLYNNIAHIYKAKGTEKAIKNIFRCFYLDDKIIKFNTYTDNVVYDLKNNLQQTVTNVNSLNFNSGSNINAVVYQKQDPDNTTESRGYISGSDGIPGFENIYGFTAEVDVLFPSFRVEYDTFDRDFTTGSIFGMHSASVDDADDTTTFTTDNANFQVYAIRPEKYSKDVYFRLTSSTSPFPFNELTSSVFLNAYDNENWNLSVRLKPSNWPLTERVSGSDIDYTYDVIFQGINARLGNIENSFTVSSSVTKALGQGLLNAAKRMYVGAQRTNITGAVLNKSDILITNAKYWAKYLDNLSLRQHTYDVENVGISSSYKNISPIDSNNNNLDILNRNALVLNWNFSDLTASDATGNFFTQDMSSGSAQIRSSYGWMGKLSGYLHSGYGYDFAANTTNIVDKRATNIFKFIDPEQAIASNMIKILSSDDTVYGFPQTIPNYYHTLEKSPSAAISEEILNFFAGVIDFNNIIGEPVNRYRERYKAMEKLREAFFRKVTTTTHVEDYMRYYQWFDDALAEIIGQFVPASGKFTEDGLNIIEGHILERNKYKSQFPTIEFRPTDPISPALGINEKTYNWKLNHHPISDLQKVNSDWWRDRAKRAGSTVIAAGESDVDAQRDTIRETIENDNDNPTRRLSTINQGSYLKSNYVVRRLTKPYKLKVERKMSPIPPIKGGVNFEQNKRIGITYNALYPAGPVNHDGGGFVPENVLFGQALHWDSGLPLDIVGLKDSTDPVKPRPGDKVKRRLKVQHGRDWYEGLSYESAKSDIVFPFNIISASVTTGYNRHVVEKVSASLVITNLHNDVYGDDMEKPMQGPFTEYAVGGHQSRHVELNKSSSTKTFFASGLDSYLDRPEAWKLLLGYCPSHHGTSSPITGAIGMVGADYPWPEANAVGATPYPMTASQKAVYYRDFVAKRPVNIKNIHHTTGSTVLGNYNHNYDFVQVAGGWSNPRQFIESQPNLPTKLFVYPMTSSTSVRTILDIYRGAADGVSTVETGSLDPSAPRPFGSASHADFSTDYSTAYLENTTNKSVIVSKFSAPGGIEVMSKGYQDFRSGEFSAYNSLNNRNLTVRRPFQHHPGAVSSSTTPREGEANGIRVYDIHGNDMGLSVLSARHADRFFRDPIRFNFNTIGPGTTYDESPCYHRVHRNNIVRPKPVYTIGISTNQSVFANTKAVGYPAITSNLASCLWISGSTYASKFLFDGASVAAKYSLTGWVKPTPPAQINAQYSGTIFSIGYTGAPSSSLEVYYAADQANQLVSPAHLHIRVPTTNASYAIGAGHWRTTTAPTAFVRDTWSHVAVTYTTESADGSAQPVPDTDPVLYVNGVVQTLTEVVAPGVALADLSKTYTSMRGQGHPQGPVLVGGYIDPGAPGVIAVRQFSGSLDEIVFFDNALSQSQIDSLYNSGIPCDLTGSSLTSSWVPATIIGWYRMGDGSGSAANGSQADSGSIGSSDVGTWRVKNMIENANHMYAVTNVNSTNSQLMYDLDALDGCGESVQYSEVITSYTCDAVYDNLNQYHPIPRSDRQYAWFTGAIVDTDPCNYRYSGYMPVHGPQAGYYSASSGYEPWMNMITASEFGLYTEAADPTVWGTNQAIIAIGNTWKGDTISQNFQPQDFAGLNTLIYEPITSSTNILGYPTGTPLFLSASWASADANWGQYRNLQHAKSFRIEVANAPSGSPPPAGSAYQWANIQYPGYVFNALMLKRNGPYGWCPFKQTRQQNHPVLRNERSSSQISVTTPDGLENYNLPALSMRGRPGILNYTPALEYDECGDPGSPGIGRLSTTLQATNNNQKIFFNDENLNIKSLPSNNPNDIITAFDYLIQTVAPAATIVPMAPGGGWRPTTRTLYDPNYLIYTENIYPSIRNEFVSSSRRRTNYDNLFWRDNRIERTTIGAQRRSSLGGVQTDGAPGISQSCWALDAPTNFLTRTGSIVGYNLLSQGTGATQAPPFTNYAYLATASTAGELQNPWIHAHFVTHSTSDFWASIYLFQRSAPLYARKHMMGGVGSVSPASGMLIPEIGHLTSSPPTDPFADMEKQVYVNTGEALWEAGEHAGIVIATGSIPKDGLPADSLSKFKFKSQKSEPWYNNYSEFREDIRLMAKDYVIVPEYRISEHVNDYLRYGINNEEKFDTFEIVGTGITSLSSSFYKDYVNSEYLREFRSIGEKTSLTAKEIRISVKAVKKFNPYKGFYPAQRTLDLAAQFSASYWSSIVAHRSDVGVPSSAYNHLSFARPVNATLFAPGILYNSIKSGLAVDYPILLAGNAKGNKVGKVPTYYLADRNLNLWMIKSNDSTTTGSNAWLRGTPFWDERLPFETMLNPARHLADKLIIDMEPHPSAAINITAAFSTNTVDESYSLMARNFFGEVADFFLSDGDYTALKSQPIVNNVLTFKTGTYGARLKLFRSCDGIRSYGTTYDAFGQKGALTGALSKNGGRYLDAGPSSQPTMLEFVSGATYPLPQDPQRHLSTKQYRENFTMYSRPTAFGPPVSGRRITTAANFKSGSLYGIKDCFNGYNWSFTPPYYHGEAWVDFIFRPDPTRTYTLEEVLDDMDTYYWRVDPGPVINTVGGAPMPAFISASHAYRNIYDGFNVNAHAMQISASLNLFGIEQTTFQETNQYGEIQSARNESNLTQWVIKPKFETPMLNFNSTVQSVSTAEGTLSIPTFGSGTVPRGMWHQFGVIEPDQNKGIFMQIDDIPTNWLRYHYLINTSASVYNENNTSAASIQQAKQMKSLTSVFNFDTAGKRLGQIATQTVVKEAIVAIPYVNIAMTAQACADGEATTPSPSMEDRKKFFSIPEERVNAALKKNTNSGPGQDLKIAGESIRKLVTKMDNYVLPPQFDFLRNPDIEPIVMYLFEFSYTLDQDDLSYIWQNLAPRGYKKVTFEEQAIAHNLNKTQLLNAQDLMTEGIRWMIFKVKQRATGDYYKHIPKQAGGALSLQQSELFNPAASQNLTIGKPFGSEPITTSEYPLQYNWPYDYLSFVEGIKIDIEILYDDASNRTRSLVRELQAQEAFAEGPIYRADIDPQEAAEALYGESVTFAPMDPSIATRPPRVYSVTTPGPTLQQGPGPYRVAVGERGTPTPAGGTIINND